MSLEIGKDSNGQIVAYKYIGVKRDVPIKYVDDEDSEIPVGERLTRIRLNLKNETFFPSVTDFFKRDQVDRIYVTGASGCGKSTWIRNYCSAFHIMYPQAKVLLFSSKTEDKLLDGVKYIERVRIDDDIVINQMKLSEISNKSKPSLCIFDDIQDFPTPKINKEITRLRDEIMRNGRAYGIFSVFVWHEVCDYVRTKHMISECNKCVIFPKRCGAGTYDYLLTKKLYLTPKNVKMINELKSNYVCISRGVLRLIISDKYIILDQ